MAADAEIIAQRVLEAFGHLDRRPPAAVEAILRPFGTISTALQHRVDSILRAAGKSDLMLAISPWIEANIVTSNEEPDRERRIQFLVMDTCTCVLDHLRAAIAHAPGSVDQRVLELLRHKHFTGGE